GSELYWIDTTQDNPTPQFININPLGQDFARNFALAGNKLFFDAYDPTYGSEVRWIDVTEASPVLHTLDVDTGTSSGRQAVVNYVPTVIGDRVFFGAHDSQYGNEVRWVDANDPTTVHTLDLNPGTGHGTPSQSPGPILGGSGSRVFFGGNRS